MPRNTSHRIPTMSVATPIQEQSVEPLLAYVIDNTPEFEAVELQNTMFYLESVFYEETGVRLTEIEWNIQKTRVSSHAVRNVLEMWVENDVVEVRKERSNNSLTANSITYYRSLNLPADTRLRDFIRETDAYDPNEPPYSSLDEQESTGEIPYKKFTEFIDNVLTDLQDSTKGHDKKIKNEREKWTVNEGVYYEWLQRHPLYEHESRYDTHVTFEDWNPAKPGK